ncbi:MAG: 50S ribosomal protein L5 [Acidobacteria bacterium]|uniref:Large ribosomal subunit protein uL5 n=1 Tax=Candidatus Tanganyikabacteria bacterium TaxID=2961651 RepID=A0A937X3W9_9BACT|nr:50S ribosomal protein L5 [Candidatus Tanganyikabacteria bacterium]MBM3773785.1 50S ribosomal protein L5 [Acidobacteriota bacterium]
MKKETKKPEAKTPKPQAKAARPEPKAAKPEAAAAKPEAGKHKATGQTPARLKQHYLKTVLPALQQEFGYQNTMAVPKLEKISLNIGLGEAIQNAKLLDGAVNELAAITGQKPVITKARKSIAAFKLREGMSIGCMVTLRGERMYEFFDRLVNVALPRVRDFRGISTKSFDGRGNYTLGVRDQLIFPEIDYAKVDKTKGINVSITTTARTDAEGLSLLRRMGMPFRP